MTTVLYVDFKNRKLIRKVDLSKEGGTNTDMESGAVVVAEEVSASEGANKEKLEHFHELISSNLVSLKVNTRFPGVTLPSKQMKNLLIEINWSLRFGIEDFRYDETGVRGTLSFNQNKFFTDIPWGAIFNIGTAQANSQKEWKESLPEGVTFPEG